MDGEADRNAADDMIFPARPLPWGRHGASLWRWPVIGSAATLAVAVLISNNSQAFPWWHASSLAVTLICGLSLTILATLLAHHRAALAQTRDESQQRLRRMAQTLDRLERDPLSAWRMLKDQQVIDGHAVWSAEDRLVNYSGFLSRYLPQLAEWRNPTGNQIVTALVDSGQLLLDSDTNRQQAIEAYCQLRQQIPGLREFRMTDGQSYMARTTCLGDGRRVTIFTNITELKRARPDRAIPDQAFRDAFSSSNAMLVLLGPDVVPLAVNATFTATLGYSLQDVRRIGWPGLLHPDEGRPGAPWLPGPYRFATAAGAQVRAVMRVSPVRGAMDGISTGLTLASIEDVTARWEADEKLRLQAALLDGIGSAVLAVDGNGRVVYGNPAAILLFQWSGAVLPHAPIQQLLGPTIGDAIARGTIVAEVEGITWSGLRFPAQVAIAPLAATAAIPAGAVLVVADLTQRRALDLQLMHSARLATLGEMAASIAHEFNQCLHVIRLSAEALQLDLDGAVPLTPFAVAKRTDNILNQVDRLSEMVLHMRTISRREGVAKRPFRPQIAVDSALRMVEPLLRVDGIYMVRRGNLGGVEVQGHQVRLEQVLLNLLNNARDAICERFRAQGNTGGTITVTTAVDDAKGRARISVRDDGLGVPAEMSSHIFEAFFTTKQEGSGCGLGLSISRGICSEMGGSLSFTSCDPGTEFTIDIPLADTLTQASPRLAPPAATPPGTHGDGGDDDGAPADDEDDFTHERRVLLVDDEALSVMMVCEFLERQGYVVDAAYDGQAALEKCQTHVYHAVITDIRMPRMDGRELIARLEELQPGTPVIVVTGHLKERNAADLGTNVQALLEKPFHLHHLRDHLLRLDDAAKPITTGGN